MLIEIFSQYTMKHSVRHWILTRKQKSATLYINCQPEIVSTGQFL